MRLVKGDHLTESVRKEVLAAYVYRLTTENGYPEHMPWPASLGKATVPAQTDAEWLASHAFWVTDAGHLAKNRHHCEPLSMIREG